MIRPVPCACGNPRPEVGRDEGDGAVVIRCRCGRYVRGYAFADAVARWDDSVEKWRDMRTMIAERRGD